MSEVFFCSKWLTRRKQNSRWLTSSSWVRMNEFELDWISLSQSFVQNGWIQDGSVWIQHGRIQNGCHHQDDSGWMSKVFLCKMAESKMVEFKMAAIITLSENEWVTFFLFKMAEYQNAQFKMADIIKISQNANEWSFWVQNGWIQGGRSQDGCHHHVESEWMSEVFLFRE